MSRPDRSPLWALAPAAVFLFILPFTHTVALRLACLFLAAVIALPAAWQRGNPTALPCRWALAFWVAVCTLSLAWSIDAAYSRKELLNEVGYTSIAFLTFFQLSGDERSWRLLKAAVAAGCAAASLVAIAYLFQSRTWPEEALIGGRNEFSTYVILALPLLVLSMVQASRTRWRLVLAAVAVLALVSAWFTLNRTMWLALLAEAVVLWWLHGRLSRAARRGGAMRAAVLVLALAGFVGAFVAASHTKSGATSLDAQALEGTVQRDLRWKIWSYGIERIRERPLLGYGYGRGILRDDFRVHLNHSHAWHAHSMVLNYALEAGVPGVLALFGLAACLGWTFLVLARVPVPETRAMGIFGVALLLGVAAKTATDDLIVRENGLFFWSLLGMGLGYARHVMVRSQDRDEPGA